MQLTLNNNVEKIKELCNGKYTPLVINKPNSKIYALGDIHGDYSVAISMLILAEAISHKTPKYPLEPTATHCKCPKWEGGDSIIVQVGDQVDSCRYMENCNTLKSEFYIDRPYDILILNMFTELDEQAQKHGGRVISLLGNHELMNAQGIHKFVSKENFTYEQKIHRNDIMLPTTNPTMEHIGCSRVASVIVNDNLFVHAGIIDKIGDNLNLFSATPEKSRHNLENINQNIQLWLLGQIALPKVNDIINPGTIDNKKTDSIFWTRILGTLPANSSQKECMNHIGKVVKFLKIDNIIIGHTPQSFQFGLNSNNACASDNNEKSVNIWRIDNGSAQGFNIYDKIFIYKREKNKSRKPQVLEIKNGKFKVIIEKETKHQ